MSLIDLDIRLGIIDIDLTIGLINIDLALGIPILGTGSTDDDVVAGSQGTDVIETLTGDDTIIGSDGIDVIDGSLGIDRFILDFTSDRHATQSAGRDVTINNLSVTTSEGPLGLFGDVQTTIVGIEGVVVRFGQSIGGEIIDTNDDTIDASAFSGSEGVQLISGGGSDEFIGSVGGDVFSFVVGAGTGTTAVADGGAGDDATIVNIDLSQSIGLTYTEAGETIGLVTSTGESILLTSVETLAFTSYTSATANPAATLVLDASAASTAILADFTDGGEAANVESDLTVLTGSGDDIIQTNAGDDTIDAGAGNDTINGGAGTDTVSYASATFAVDVSLQVTGAQDTGGGGVDTLNSIENLTGSSFSDALIGDERSNTLLGLDGDDTIYGLSSSDYMDGNAGDDILVAGLGFDILLGGDGNDHLTGGLGDDTMTGDLGDDTLIGNDGSDNLDGGDGNDTIVGGIGADIIEGRQGHDMIRGGVGDDTIDGGFGDDTIHGNAGADTIFGFFGDDMVLAGVGADLVYGGAGNDTLEGNAGHDTIYGGDGNDMISGDGGRDDLYGEDGNDVLIGSFGKDTMTGGAGADLFVFGNINETLATANAADTITDFSQAEGDSIDLSGVGSFTFVGENGFSGAAGELRYYFDGSGDTIVEMDIDGDATSELAIRLTGEINLEANDFAIGEMASAFENDGKAEADTILFTGLGSSNDLALTGVEFAF